MSDTTPPADHAFVEEQDEGNGIEKNLKSKATWTRLLFMFISLVFVWLASMVGMVVIVFGFLMVLFTGEINRELRGMGQSLATYVYENIRFLTFNTDDRPFPFGNEWPSAGDDEEQD